MPVINLPHFYDQPGVHTVILKGPSGQISDVWDGSRGVFKRQGYLNRTWVNTPNFFKLRKLRQRIPPALFIVQYTERNELVGGFTWGPTHPSPTDVFTSIDGVLFDSPNGQYCNWVLNSAGYGYDPSVEGRTATKLLEKIKDSKVNVAQAFAERKQTADMLVATATRITQSVRQFRKGNIYGALQAIGQSPTRKTMQRLNRKSSLARPKSGRLAISDARLELQYGWTPLLQDVYGAAEAVAKANSHPHPVHKVTSSTVINDNRSVKRFVGLSECIEVHEAVMSRSSCKMSVVFEVTNGAAKTMSETGISNPVNLAWELLPFSFVVDWFLPVGSYLSNFDATAGCTFLSGVKSTAWRFVKKSQGSGRQNVGSSGDITYTGFADGEFRQGILQRAPLGNFPGNPLPAFKDPFSTSHIWNAIALLSSAFR